MKDIYSIDTEKLIENLDFAKIQAYMILTKWKYNNKIPSIKELRNTAYELLNVVEENISVRPNKNSFCRGGGFKISYYADLKKIVIDFVIERNELTL